MSVMSLENNQRNRKKVFFCGAMLNYEGLKRYKGETPAASIWIKGLFSGLMDNDVEITCFSPIWDTLFPKGRLFPGKRIYLDHMVKQVLVRYFNVPFLRTATVAYFLERAILNAIKKDGMPDGILNYNTYPYYCKALQKLSKKYPNLPWVNVVLDLDDPTRDNWGAFLRDTLGSKGSIFLSWWGYQNAPIETKHHMDAGWTGEFLEVDYNNQKIFLYAGKYAKFGGIDDIIEAIKLYPKKDAIFQFYGKDVYAPLNELATVDERVQIKGFVSDEELDTACKNATAFLSPREFNFQGTRMIFPSKIMFYLKYQKPIISAMLPGLSPDYEAILVQPDENTPEAWAACMDKVLQMTNMELHTISEKSKVLLEKKRWASQAKALIHFLETI